MVQIDRWAGRNSPVCFFFVALLDWDPGRTETKAASLGVPSSHRCNWLLIARFRMTCLVYRGLAQNKALGHAVIPMVLPLFASTLAVVSLMTLLVQENITHVYSCSILQPRGSCRARVSRVSGYLHLRILFYFPYW